MIRIVKYVSIFIINFLIVACDKIDSNRIPYSPVNIQLNNDGLWNTYGVNGAGENRRFIKPDIPSRAFYTALSYTGYGGILLFCNSQNLPCAYDLSCPVEVKQSVRVFVNEALEAECPQCGSRYSVLLGDGGPIFGPALDYHYGLQRYKVTPQPLGGYIVHN